MEPYLKATPSGFQSPLLTSTSKDDDSNQDLRRSIPKEQDHSGLTTPTHVSLHDRELKASPLNPAAALNPVRQNIPNPSEFNEHWWSYIESDQSSWPLYKNFDEGSIKYAVQVGNHKLISLRDNEKPYTSNLAKEIQQEFIRQSKFNYIAEFLTSHKEIRYIVDIGCGDVEKSLLLQQYLNQHGLDVTVCPVDIILEDDCHLPLNLIPAERIKGADQNVAFTVIHAQTDEFMELDDKYYIKTLIQNNPDSFVLVSEDPYFSSPNNFIPPELIYTKRFDTNKSPKESYELKKKLDVINQIMDKFPASRNMSTKVLKEITNSCYDTLKPPKCYEAIFSTYLDSMLEKQGFKNYKSRQWTHQWGKGSVELKVFNREQGYLNWHVYRKNPEEPKRTYKKPRESAVSCIQS